MTKPTKGLLPSEWSLDNLPPYLVLAGKKLLMLDPLHRTEAEKEVFVALLKQLQPILPGEDQYRNPLPLDTKELFRLAVEESDKRFAERDRRRWDPVVRAERAAEVAAAQRKGRWKQVAKRFGCGTAVAAVVLLVAFNIFADAVGLTETQSKVATAVGTTLVLVFGAAIVLVFVAGLVASILDEITSGRDSEQEGTGWGDDADGDQ